MFIVLLSHKNRGMMRLLTEQGDRKRGVRAVSSVNCGRDDRESGNRLWVWDCGKEVSPEGERSRRSSRRR